MQVIFDRKFCKKENWTNELTDKQYVFFCVTLYNSSLASLVATLRILNEVVPENCLKKIKFTNRHTDKHSYRKATNHTPFNYLLYRGCNYLCSHTKSSCLQFMCKG